MNVRQQFYKKYRLEGMSKYAAARKAGYSHSYATQAKNIEKRMNMADLLEMEGLTDKALSQHAREGLNAVKIQGCDIYVYQDKDGKWKVNESKNEFIEAPDWNVRHKYLDTILKLKNKLNDKLLIDQSKHQNFEIVVFAKSEENEDTRSRISELHSSLAD